MRYFMDALLVKPVVAVRYSDVQIVDRREPDNVWTETLYGFELGTDTKDVPLSKDKVWLELYDKFSRLGYDLSLPAEVVRIQTKIDPSQDFYWSFDSYDEKRKQELEAEAMS